ncbi:MAG: hypothetical protein AAGG44_16160 [Planctomycetota bacterium]
MSDLNLIQKTIQDQVENEATGLLSEIQELNDLLQQNGLAGSPLANELNAMAEQLTRVSESSLEQASESSEDALLAARRRLADEQTIPIDEELLEKQALASKAIQSALDDLQQLLGRRARSASGQRMQNDLKRIIDDQQALRDETQGLEVETVKNANLPALAAQARVLGTDQSTLARDLDRLVAELQASVSASANEVSEGSSDVGSEIANEILGARVSQRMRQAVEYLSNEKLSSALVQQDQVLTALREIISKISSGKGDQSVSDFANRASEMQRAAQQLSELSALQRQLAEAIPASNTAEAEALSRQQEELKKQVEDQLSRLASSMPSQAIDSLESALADQERVQTELAVSNLIEAGEAAGRAADALTEATRALDRNAQDMELQAQEQRVYRLEEEIDQLLEAQQPLVAEIEQLGAMIEKARAAGDVVSDSETLAELAAREDVVANRVERLIADATIEELANLPGFSWVLEQTYSDLQRAVAALQRARVKPEAVDSSIAAMRKLELLKESLVQSSEQSNDAAAAEEQNPDDRGDEEENQSKIPPLASLKLLRGVQADINQRTIAVHESDSSPGFREMRLRELSQQQQALAKQLEMLIEESSQK